MSLRLSCYTLINLQRDQLNMLHRNQFKRINLQRDQLNILHIDQFKRINLQRDQLTVTATYSSV